MPLVRPRSRTSGHTHRRTHRPPPPVAAVAAGDSMTIESRSSSKTENFLSPVHTSNNVEATLSKQRSTLSKGRDFNAKLVRHCCRFWQQCRTLLRHCCWCGPGFNANKTTSCCLSSDVLSVIIMIERVEIRSKQCIAVYHQLMSSPLRETHMPYGITQCYRPPDRGENPAFTPSRSRYSIERPRRDARLTYVT